jgi:hypothetical protein
MKALRGGRLGCLVLLAALVPSRFTAKHQSSQEDRHDRPKDRK